MKDNLKYNLPTYSALISDESEGVFVISLVDAPATETNWMCFKEQENIQENVKFSIVNEDEHILAGVVMVADKPIYRIAPDGTEFYIVFSKDVIKRMAEKMLDDNTFNNIDIQHDGNIIPRDKVKLVELFIADEAKGIKPNYLDVPDGSLLANYKIYDEQLWQMAKSGALNGFSLEGVFSTLRLPEQNKNTKNTKNNKHTKMSKIKEMLKSILVQLGEVNTDKGILTYDGNLAPGVEVKNEDGSKPADGEYKLEDGKVIVVKDGYVDEVREIENETIKEKPKGKEEKSAEMAEEKPQEKPASEMPEKKPEEKPNEVEELKKLVDEHAALLKELSDRLSALEELVKELNETPAVEPIEQEFSKHFKSKNRACEYANALRK